MLQIQSLRIKTFISKTFHSKEEIDIILSQSPELDQAWLLRILFSSISF